MAPGVPLYNEAITIHRHGPCTPSLLADSLNEVVRRHEIWRTDFQLRGTDIIQRVHDNLVLELPFDDLSALPEEEREAAALRLATEDARLAFDLGQAPLLRGRIVKFGNADHRLFIALHHIIFDGVSLYRVLLPSLAAVYAQLAEQKPAPSAAPSLQYGDYAVWRAERLKGEAATGQMAHWQRVLSGELPSCRLPVDRAARDVPTHRGGMETFTLSPGMSRHIKTKSLELGGSTYGFLLTVFKTLLFRYTGQADLIVGSVVDMRKHRSLETTMGYFLNTLPVRTHPEPGMSFRSYAAQTGDTLLGMIEASDIPLLHLVRSLQPHRDTALRPLFEAVFSIQPPSPPSAEGWDLTQMDVAVGAAKFDLYLEIEQRPHGLIGRFLYSTDLFDAPTIRRMIGHWITILQAVLDNLDCPLGEMKLLTSEEDAQLAEWNTTSRAIPANSVHALFEAQQRRVPGSVAVRWAGRTFTYDQLNQRANRIAAWLCHAGVAPGDVIGLCLERDGDMLACLLGILKAGAAYLPLDPAQPSARLQDCLASAAVKIVLTTKSLLATLPHAGARILLLEDATLCGFDPAFLSLSTDPESLAYVLCTSGTTGQPKAVEITHRAVVNLLLAMRDLVAFDESDSLLAITTVSFDIAALELFLPLLCGGCVILASSEIVTDPVRLAQHIDRNLPTVMQATPSTWRALTEAGWRGHAGLRLLVGGEMLPRSLADELLQRAASVWNMYGPTETTIWSTACRVEPGDGSPPIGRPIANTTIFVADCFGNRLPVGAQGELCIGGAGLARGYRGQAILTGQRFAALPATSGQRAYRTGDVVRLRADGVLEWLGRLDDQLKIRGHRVEPGEIEATLTALPGVHCAAVTAHRDITGFQSLVAHVVAPGLDPESLRDQAARRLPSYMVPGRFVLHAQLPLNGNGKIDRGRLAQSRPPTPTGTQPATATERRLADIWRRLLGVEAVDTSADFFLLGGHSLLAMRLLADITTEFGCRIAPASLFHSPTIQSLALTIEGKPAALANAASAKRVRKTNRHVLETLTLRRLRAARGVSRGIVLAMPGLFGHAMKAGVIAAHALENYEVWAFAVETGGRKLVENEAWIDCAQEIAARLSTADAIRPVAFFGFSMGGSVAWLVDRLLVAAGHAARPVINFDGGAAHTHTEAGRCRVAALLPGLPSLAPGRMLLLDRLSPGKFVLGERSETEWRSAGASFDRLSYRTTSHLDVILPQAIAAAAGALASFIQTGRVASTLAVDALEFGTLGGVLFRMLADPHPPDLAEIRSLVKAPLPADGHARLIVLFLAACKGDAEIALAYARRLGAGNRAAIYARIGLLTETGREHQASALADTWLREHPSDDLVMSRPPRQSRQPAKWGSVEGLKIWSDESFDFARGLPRQVERRAPRPAVAWAQPNPP